MTIISNWRYLLMLAVALAGVAVPYWLWNMDQNPKAISIQLTSQVQLGLSEDAAIPGLQILIEGTPIPNPVLSTVLVQNTGGQPITTADFESPIKILPSNGSTIYSARLSGKNPEDIEPTIGWDETSIWIMPTLLNPNDSITLSIVSSGTQSSFSARARIIGVSAIEVDNSETSAPNLRQRWAMLVAAFLCAIPTMAAYRHVDLLSPAQETITLRKRTVLAISLTLGTTSLLAWFAFFWTYGIFNFWIIWLSSLIMFFAALIVGIKLDSYPRQPHGKQDSTP